MSTVALWLKRGFIGARSFTPGRLFAANEQGAWYDPSDFSTLFQDSAGTTPVTAVEQPVGLMLDKSRGPVLDANVVTNGSFDTNLTGWTLSQTAGATLPVWSAGALKLVSDGTGFSRADQQLNVVSGQAYRITLSLTHPGGGGSADLTVGTAQGGSDLLSGQNITLTGTFTYTFVANGTTAWIRLSTGSNNATGYLLDNVVVRAATELVPTTYSGAVSGSWLIGANNITRNGSSAGQASLTLDAAISTSKTYLVQLTVADLSGDTLLYRLGAGGTAYQISANGTYTARVVGGATAASLVFAPWAGSAGQATITNISVREIPGNHAFQATAASRPTLRAKYNLFERTEEFNDAVWTKVNVGITANATAAPDNTTTADAHVSANGTLNREISRSGFPVVSGAVYTLSVYLKYDASGAAPWVELTTVTGAVKRTWVNTQTGAIGVTGHTSATATDAGNGWWRFSITYTTGGTSEQFYISSRPANGDSSLTTANGTAIQFYIWGAQLLTAADQTATGGAYQRVGAATDYATGGLFRPYLAFDGVDDSMATNSVDFTTVTSDGLPRRNLFSNPTQLDVASVWTADNAVVTANTGTAPDGSTSADTVTTSGTAVIQRVRQTVSNTGQITFSVYAKAGTAQFLQLLQNTDANAFANFNLTTGTVGTVGTGATATITAAGSGWYRCALTYTIASTGNWQIYIAPSASATYGEAFPATVAALSIWGMQLETGSTLTGFQNIGTDRMSVFAGLHKASDAARGILLELGVGSDGRIIIQAPESPGSNLLNYTARGTIDVGATSPAAAPSTRVFTGLDDISADSVRLRLNGAQVDQSSSDMGVGNHANGALNIGNRQGGTLFFNGRLYALAVLGRTATPAEIAATEAWVNSKTGAY